MEEGLGFIAYGEIGWTGHSRGLPGLRPEEEEEPDVWGLGVREKKGGSYRFGRERCWAVGSIWSWAGLVPAALFFCSFLFLFLISNSFIKFANEHQINSNQSRVFSKIHNNVLKQ
jgi:hypothetical protein